MISLEKKMTSAIFTEHLKNSSGILTLEKAVYHWNKKDAYALRYYFSNTDQAPVQYVGMLVKDQKNLIIDGQGSTLLFRGHMAPVVIDGCENITLRNFIIDFDPPLVAEGEVVGRGENTADVRIDRSLYPCEMKDNWLHFDIGEEESSEFFRPTQIHFSRDLCVTPGTGDDFHPTAVEQIADDVFRITARRRPKDEAPYVGDWFVLRHNMRLHPAALVENSKNITFENITVYNCGGLGLLCQFNDTLTFRRVFFEPNTAAGRRIFSGRDDGLHLTSNKGHILVEDCSFVGLMDDPINVHGCSVKVLSIHEDRRSLRVRFMHDQAYGFHHFARPGDRISLIDQNNMSEVATYTVDKCIREDERELTIFTREEIQETADHLALENITNVVDFTCRRNRFGSCRARGVLISTRGKVVVEENLFESSGTALLFAGDANGWYESGECRDVTVRKNIFTDKCMSSMYGASSGFITIHPEIPHPEMDKPFHKNLVIEENVFYTPDTPLLDAFSAQNLVFRNNLVFRSTGRENITGKDSLFLLRWCRDVEITGNRMTGNFRMHAIEAENVENLTADM